MTQHSTRLRSFGRIKTHAFSPYQQALINAHEKNYAVPALDENQTKEQKQQQRGEWLSQIKHTYPKIALEIGFGAGEHLIYRALATEDEFWIGAEPFLNGWIKALSEIVDKDIENIALYKDDVRGLLETFPENCLDKVCILYPDPWPKNKHHKRRLINDELIQLLGHVLKSGGIVQLATDISDYARWSLNYFAHYPDLFSSPVYNLQEDETANEQASYTGMNKNLERFNTPFEGWQITRYEEKAKRAARNSYYMTFVKK